MNGIDRAEAFYRERVSPMIDRCFPEYAGRIAAGIAGQGSDCSGFDDAVSSDHDNGTGVCLWLDQETYDIIGAELKREYASVAYADSPRKGVYTVDGFYRELTGLPGGPVTWRQWMSVPPHYLADATNGRVFRDDAGAFTAVREHILYGMPEDVRLKKIAGRLALMAQSGQYNYARCLAHGERGAAELAAHEFVSHSLNLIFLLNCMHAPFYKWQFRALRGASVLAEAVPLTERLALLGADRSDDKQELIEAVCGMTAAELRTQGLSTSGGTYLEDHAMSVTERIADSEIRGLHLMEC